MIIALSLKIGLNNFDTGQFLRVNHAHDKHQDLHTKFQWVGVSELVISQHNEGPSSTERGACMQRGQEVPPGNPAAITAG